MPLNNGVQPVGAPRNYFGIFGPSRNLLGVRMGQEGLENDSEAYGFFQSSYELISSHMDPFQIKFHAFHQKLTVLGTGC